MPPKPNDKFIPVEVRQGLYQIYRYEPFPEEPERYVNHKWMEAYKSKEACEEAINLLNDKE